MKAPLHTAANPISGRWQCLSRCHLTSVVLLACMILHACSCRAVRLCVCRSSKAAVGSTCVCVLLHDQGLMHDLHWVLCVCVSAGQWKAAAGPEGGPGRASWCQIEAHCVWDKIISHAPEGRWLDGNVHVHSCVRCCI